MILWKSKVKSEDEPMFPHLGRRSWRWILETTIWKNAVKGIGIGLTEQVRFDEKSSEWESANRYFDISLTDYWGLGSFHAYYDGPNCSFSLGFLHFSWSYDHCEKCMPTGTL